MEGIAIQQGSPNALQPANNLSDVASAATSRTNLGVPNIAGDTFTGNVTVSNPVAGTGSANVKAIVALTPNAISGDTTAITFGQAGSANNQAEFQFNYVGAGSTSNRIRLGFFGTNNILQITPDKVVALQGVLDLSAASAGQIPMPATQNPSSNANTFDDYEEGTYTPTWNATADPAIGNGTITGAYLKLGKFVHAELRITMGSTTTYGTGAWLLGLPFTQGTTNGSGTCHGFDSGTANRLGACISNGLDTKIQVASDGSGAQWQSTVPHTWAVSDYLNLVYPFIASA